MPDTVKAADDVLLATEVRDLFLPPAGKWPDLAIPQRQRVVAWSSALAWNRFWRRWEVARADGRGGTAFERRRRGGVMTRKMALWLHQDPARGVGKEAASVGGGGIDLSQQAFVNGDVDADGAARRGQKWDQGEDGVTEIKPIFVGSADFVEGARGWDRVAVLAHQVDVRRQRLTGVPDGIFIGVPGAGAARKIGKNHAEAAIGGTVENGEIVLHGMSPASGGDSGLSANAADGTGGKVLAGVRDSDLAGLGWVSEMMVAAYGGNMPPSIGLDLLDHVPAAVALHRSPPVDVYYNTHFMGFGQGKMCIPILIFFGPKTKSPMGNKRHPCCGAGASIWRQRVA